MYLYTRCFGIMYFILLLTSLEKLCCPYFQSRKLRPEMWPQRERQGLEENLCLSLKEV